MDPVSAEATAAAVRQLEALADDLTGRGFDAQVSTATGLAEITVTHRAVRQMSESVFAVRAPDGEWWLWWSWGDPLARITDIDAAAFKIAYVLTPHTEAGQATAP